MNQGWLSGEIDKRQKEIEFPDPPEWIHGCYQARSVKVRKDRKESFRHGLDPEVNHGCYQARSAKAVKRYKDTFEKYFLSEYKYPQFPSRI